MGDESSLTTHVSRPDFASVDNIESCAGNVVRKVVEATIYTKVGKIEYLRNILKCVPEVAQHHGGA